MKNMHFKRAMLVLMLLVMTLSAVTGGTIAWFTDSVNSESNIIKSGTLDIEMNWADGETDPASTTWTDASKGAIFNYDLWEPGYTEVRHLAIKNAGTLALKYQLNIVANGMTSKLADAIDVYCVTPATQIGSRTELKDKWKIGTLTEVLAGKQISQHNLLAGKNATATVALKMRESAGNEYQNLAIGSDFSVKLEATQLTSEFDSFDNTYDEDAKLNETIADGLYYDGEETYYITNYNGLKAMAGIINATTAYTPGMFDEATVLLMNDIDMGGAEWQPIGDDRFARTEFRGTFDGQGHTISNFKVTQHKENDENKSSYGLFGNVKGTVKNLTVKNAVVYVPNGKFSAALIGRLNGGLVENCHVISSSVKIDDWTVGGLVGQLNAGDIKNCSVEDTTITGYAAVGAVAGIRLNAGVNTIENCSVKNCTLVQNGYFGGDYDKMFGAVLGATYNGNAVVNIKNCTVQDTTIKGALSYEVCGYIANGDDVNLDGSTRVIKYDKSTMGPLYDTIAGLKSGEVLELPAGTYTISGTFKVPAGVTLMGAEGAKVIIRQNSAAQDNILACAGDVMLCNITFESNSKGYAVADNTKNHDTDGDITIINCKFNGIAAEKNWGVYKNLNGNLTIKNCTFDTYNNGICGVNNGNGSTTVITGCTFTNIDGEAIGYVASTLPADFESEVIKNNTGLTAENVIGY